MRQLPQKIEDSRAISATLDTGVAASSGTGVGVCIARQGWERDWILETYPLLTIQSDVYGSGIDY